MLHFLLLLQLQAKAEAENSEVAANTTDKMTLVSTLKLFLQSGPIETKWNRYVHQWVKLWRVWGSGKKEESMICMICYKFWEISEMSVSDLLYIWDWKVEPDKDTRWLKPQRGMWGWYKKLSRVNVKKKGKSYKVAQSCFHHRYRQQLLQNIFTLWLRSCAFFRLYI